MEAVAHENYKRRTPGVAGILAYAISYSKKGAVSESREIVRVAYLGKIMNIGSSRTRKLKKERSREGWDISLHDCARESGYRLGIVQNGTGSIFRANNDCWTRSHAKIIKRALPGWPVY